MIENRYHKFLNIPDYIPIINTDEYESDNKKWLEFHKSLSFEQLNNDKILPWLNTLGYTSHWIEFFYTPPKDSGIIHSDNVYWADWAKLIFQFGAKGSKMRWWSSDNVYQVSTSVEQISQTHIPEISQYKIGDRNNDHYHGQVLVSREEESNLEYEIEVGRCSLVNVGPLHSSYNPTNDKRFTLTIALFDMYTGDRILWDEALKTLKPYIVEESIDS